LSSVYPARPSLYPRTVTHTHRLKWADCWRHERHSALFVALHTEAAGPRSITELD